MTVTGYNTMQDAHPAFAQRVPPEADNRAAAAEEHAFRMICQLASAFGLTRKEAALVWAVAGTSARFDKLLPNAGNDVGAASQSIFVFGDVRVDTGKRLVTSSGQVVPLRPKEYDLLIALARAEGGAVANETLLLQVWGGRVSPGSRTIAQHVSCLRRKLEADSARPQHLVTVQGFGYRLIGSWSS